MITPKIPNTVPAKMAKRIVRVMNFTRPGVTVLKRNATIKK